MLLAFRFVFTSRDGDAPHQATVMWLHIVGQLAAEWSFHAWRAHNSYKLAFSKLGSYLNVFRMVMFPPFRGRVFNTVSKQMSRRGSLNLYYNIITENYAVTAAERTIMLLVLFLRSTFFPIKESEQRTKC